MPRPVSGFCVVRVEVERRGLLIVLVLNPDRSQTSTERSETFGDIDEAVGVVREFLVRFVTDNTKPSE
ncbi:MAG TPA: hypothetical protein VJ966_06615 [Actinomycetes bacterium]|nr:hypothetical protein [Actinomycetes bacterium]